MVYNRPVHTGKVLAALAANVGAQESNLYIYSDAPRSVQDEASVAAVRQLAKEAVGFKTVTLVERPFNYGCGRNEISAITETLETYDRCIVVEDDVETCPLFLSYINRGLELYANDERFYSIGAYSYPFKKPKWFHEPTFMAQRNCSWGWGTWKRAWSQMDFDCDILHKGMADKAVRKAFSKSCGDDWLRTYKRIPAHRLPDIWDIRLTFRLGSWVCSPYSLLSILHETLERWFGYRYDAGSLKSVDKNRWQIDCGV